MKIIALITGVIFIIFCTNDVGSQELTQSIRGKVVDKDSQMPLFGANLLIEGSDPLVGTTTNINGEFSFGKLEVGRYNIIIYYVGYEKKTISNVLLNSGKEAVLFIELTESVVNLNEVVITGKRNPGESINQLATVSARSFTVEETRRFAGSMNDPSRMASSFAGVAASPSGTNDIIIRGNSPRGVLWRLEGIEIPNPNHFAEEGASGGGISIFNGTTLGNSDFFTGAFPAEYGNAYSGVFDIRLRNGNDQRREYSIQAGLLGTDCTLEGPFIKGKSSSYLLNYRYSTLAIFNGLGINLVGDAVPEFQDLTFKVRVPTKKAGVFSLFGIGGISKVYEEDDSFRNDFRTGMAAIGLSNTYFINEKTFIKSYFAYTGSKNIQNFRKPDEINYYHTKAIDDFICQAAKTSVNINWKFNSRNMVKAGIIYSYLRYDLFSEQYDEELDKLVTEIDQTGTTALLQSYVNWKYRFNEELTLVTGIHSMYFFLNGNHTVEPRLGLKWQFNPSQAVSLGFGIHSKIESLSTYFVQQEQIGGIVYMPNEGLDFTKAQHYVIGYENMLTENLFLKVETYYQYLFDVPVEDSDTSTFSVINYGHGYTNRILVNTGTGRNAGVEITLEKYFAKNYYFLVTSSFFDSRYKAPDGTVRNTRYNGNYVLNVLGGKDFVLGKTRKRILSLSVRGSRAGGQRTTPIDIMQSETKGFTVRKEQDAFTGQWDDYMRIDFKISLTFNRKKATHTIELDIQNVTNTLNTIGDYYDTESGSIETITQMGIVPVFNYRVEF